MLLKAFRTIAIWTFPGQVSRSVHLKSPVSSRILPPAKMEIKLTDIEDQVCTLLDECTQQMKNENGMTTSCRVAGGWVRDKVNMGHPADMFRSHLRTYLFHSC